MRLLSEFSSDRFLKKKSISIVLITATEGRTIAQVEKRFDLGIPFRADETDLKAMIRSNPGLLLLHHGVVLKKWYYYDFPVGKEVKKYLISPAQ